MFSGDLQEYQNKEARVETTRIYSKGQMKWRI